MSLQLRVTSSGRHISLADSGRGVLYVDRYSGSRGLERKRSEPEILYLSYLLFIKDTFHLMFKGQKNLLFFCKNVLCDKYLSVSI